MTEQTQTSSKVMLDAARSEVTLYEDHLKILHDRRRELEAEIEDTILCVSAARKRRDELLKEQLERRSYDFCD